MLLALVALGALSVPQNALAKERSFVLPNGLRVILVEAPDASRAAILVNVAAGSADERSDQRGIAHLAEHVFARGFTLGERHALQAADLGGEEINAGTDFDRTNFYWTVPAQKLDQALALEADRMRAAAGAVALGGFAIEKRIVLAEMREMSWQLDTRVKSVAFPQIFGKWHPHASLPIGTEASLAGIDVQALTNWFGRWYRPSNMELIVVAPMALRRMEQTVRKNFDFPGSPGVTRAQGAFRVEGNDLPGIVSIQADKASVTLYGAAPQLSHPHSAALEGAVANVKNDFFAAVRARYGDGASGTIWYRTSDRAGNIGARITFPQFSPPADAGIFIAKWLTNVSIADYDPSAWKPSPRPAPGSALGQAFASLLGDRERRTRIAEIKPDEAEAVFAVWFRRPLLTILTERKNVSADVVSFAVGCWLVSTRPTVHPDMSRVVIAQASEERLQSRHCGKDFSTGFERTLQELFREQLGWTYSVTRNLAGQGGDGANFSFLVETGNVDRLAAVLKDIQPGGVIKPSQ